MKLLLIEDDVVDQKAFLRAARSVEMNVEVSCYVSVEAVVEVMDGLVIPDLIVTDMQLPGARGVELPQHLEGRGRLETVPIIMLSTSAEVEDIKSSYQCGMSGYFCKPVRLNEWRDLLRTILSYWEMAETTRVNWEYD